MDDRVHMQVAGQIVCGTVDPEVWATHPKNMTCPECRTAYHHATVEEVDDGLYQARCWSGCSWSGQVTDRWITADDEAEAHR